MLGLAMAMLLQVAPVPAPLLRPSVITNPDWLVRPTAEDLADVYPPSAAERGVGGRAVLVCRVNAKGVLVDCTAQDETPAGEGFGDAVLALAARIRMRPATRDGMPIDGGTVRIPIRFDAPPPPPVADRLVTNPEWVRIPTGQDIARVYPEAATRAGIQGRAITSCLVTAHGLLTACTTLEETPAGAGFGKAALKLMPLFRMRPLTRDGTAVGGGAVKIPIRFIITHG